EDFVERAGEGIATGELVWVRAEASLEGVHFGGAVVLHQNCRYESAFLGLCMLSLCRRPDNFLISKGEYCRASVGG
ncbi:MAG: hypothetical protein SV375_14500, partial [Thermodesulfobacteriota bacterium]|nr:hypothetical protein [Thermodesulfobacteriota bacterium]